MKNPLQPVIVLGKGTMFSIRLDNKPMAPFRKRCAFCDAKLCYKDEMKATYICQSTCSTDVWGKHNGLWTVSVQCFERYHKMVARKFRKLQQTRK